MAERRPADHPTRPALAIERVASRRQRDAFLAVPAAIYADDPNWVAPLLLERKRYLDTGRNPYFAHAEAAFWLVRRGDRPVGRISAQVNRAHLAQHHDRTGHFGFLEATDDAEVFALLLTTAQTWLRRRGMARILGPFSLSINDECGLLVEGFDRKPFLMMGHARPYYRSRIEALGYRKAKDLICYAFDPGAPLPAAAETVLKRLGKEDRLTFRPLDMAHLERDVRAVVDIFNDAWSRHWGFVPFSERELAHLAASLRPLIRPAFTCIAEIEGRPVAFAISLPNLNEAIADLGGRLFPLGWAKLLWRLKVRGVKSARMPMMGVRRSYQASALGMALAVGVIEAVRREHARAGTTEAELSWILEDNQPVRRLIEMLGGRISKVYRTYCKELE